MTAAREVVRISGVRTLAVPASDSSAARVLHVVCAGEAAGAERQLLDLVSHPEATGATHAIALFTPSERVADHFRSRGLRVHDRGRVQEHAVAYLWRTLGPSDVAWLRTVIAREGANIVHLHTQASHVLGTRAALAEDAKIVRTEHDTRHFVDPSCSPFTRWSLRRAHAVVAVAGHVADYVAQTAPYAADRIVVVKNGVDTDYFSPSGARRASDKPFTFVMACRLEPSKQVDVALQALARVPPARLIVAGDGSQRRKLEAVARAWSVESRVEFRGFLPDPRPALEEADAGLSASRHESFGLSVLEAMAMARPVVAFAVGGLRELVQHGKTGWLAQSLTASELAARMQEAMDRPERAHAMGLKAREYAVRQCGLAAMCAGYAAVYGRLAHAPFAPAIHAPRDQAR